MDNLARVMIILVFTLAGAMIGSAQTPPPSVPVKPPTANDAAPPPPPPAPAPSKNVGKAKVYYFPQNNVTRAKVHFEVIGKFHDMYEKKDVLQMEANYDVSGNKPIKPESVLFIFSASSRVLTLKFV